jgi:hypothetical protein
VWKDVGTPGVDENRTEAHLGELWPSPKTPHIMDNLFQFFPLAICPLKSSSKLLSDQAMNREHKIQSTRGEPFLCFAIAGVVILYK